MGREALKGAWYHGCMDEDVKRLLLENLQLSRENNRLLRKLKRADTMRTVLSLMYWVVIIIVPVYLYYAYVAPYLIELRRSYENLEAQAAKMEQIPEGMQIYLDSLKKLFPGEEGAE
jgi:hypothetical protein